MKKEKITQKLWVSPVLLGSPHKCLQLMGGTMEKSEGNKIPQGLIFVTNHLAELETQFTDDREAFSFEQNIFDPWFGYV